MHRHKWTVVSKEVKKSPYELAIESGRGWSADGNAVAIMTHHEVIVHQKCMKCSVERVRVL